MAVLVRVANVPYPLVCTSSDVVGFEANHAKLINIAQRNMRKFGSRRLTTVLLIVLLQKIYHTHSKYLFPKTSLHVTGNICTLSFLLRITITAAATIEEREVPARYFSLKYGLLLYRFGYVILRVNIL